MAQCRSIFRINRKNARLRVTVKNEFPFCIFIVFLPTSEQSDYAFLVKARACYFVVTLWKILSTMFNILCFNICHFGYTILYFSTTETKRLIVYEFGIYLN